MVGAIVLLLTDAASQEPVVGSAQRVVMARARAQRNAAVQHCVEFVASRRYFQHAHFVPIVGVGKERRILIGPEAGRPGSSEVPRNPLRRWDVSSTPANGIFLTKKLKKQK